MLLGLRWNSRVFAKTKRQMCSWVQEKCMMNTRTTSWVARGHETSSFGRTTILDPWVVFSHAVSMHPLNAWNITCEVCTVYSYKGTSATRVSKKKTAARPSGSGTEWPACRGKGQGYGQHRRCRDEVPHCGASVSILILGKVLRQLKLQSNSWYQPGKNSN